jgi:L-seryl-tRNA(Ser) seleniumtransferase
MSKHDRHENLRLLPSIDALLQTATAARIRRQSGAKHLTVLARTLTNALRREMLDEPSGDKNYSREELLAEAEKNLEKLWRDERNSRLSRVINATGVIVHTNLGRAPLSDEAVKALTENAARYCTLEYDLTMGERGRRGARVEDLLAELTSADDALVVNNCAAAAFLVLTVLARGGEAIISRGELVEIGGDFRIPDVLEQSGARLKEVGTTNRTRVSDYERAVSENTKLILRVHPSNYRIVGFTHAPALCELAELAREKDILLYEDAGSGAMFDLSRYGLTDEPVISDSIRAGADVVTFSGDKLLGGVQSGLIVGRGETIEKIRKHPLYRALRVDKLIYAALEATLEAFQRETAFEEIPVLKMLSMSEAEIKERIKKFAGRLKKTMDETCGLKFEIIKGNSVIGGGSAPTIQPETTLLALKHRKMSAAVLEQALRLSEPPVIGRILEDKVLIDLRTVSEDEEAELLDLLAELNHE